jgi:hypothetical protein
MDFYSLIELSQIKAIQLAIEPSLESIWRIKCRQYATTFHTPLHVVMNELDPTMVLQALYEQQYTPGMVDEELEELLDILNKIKDPTYSRMSPEETENLVDAVLNREIERAAKKKAPTQQTIETAIKTAAVKPKSGGMDFSQLETMESKAETNKAGFDPQ